MTTLHERLLALIADMDSRFTSGNSVPVRVTHLHATKWAEIRAALEAVTALQSSGGEVVVPSGEEFRLLMGEMDTEQVCIAQAAFRMGAQAVLASPAQPSGFVLVPDHYDANVAYAACVLEQSACAIDRLNAPPLRKLVSLMRKKPNASAAPAPIEQEG